MYSIICFSESTSDSHHPSSS